MNTIILEVKSNINEFVSQKFENQNTIVNVSNFENLTVKELNLFLPIIKTFNQQKKTFVIVSNKINSNKVSNKINVVPTIQEAHDIIEMEEIERDLDSY